MDAKKRQEALEICKACPYFNKYVGTCGTPVVGNFVKLPDESTAYLCGCVMWLKTQLLESPHCPLLKW